MNRFFTFLMAVMALLAYATNVKAENVYLLTDQQVDGIVGSTNIPSSHKMELVSGTTYKYTFKNVPSDNFHFRIGVQGWGNQMDAHENDHALPVYTSSPTDAQKYKCDHWTSSNFWSIKDCSSYESLSVYVDINPYGTKYVWVEGTKSSVSQKTFTLLKNDEAVSSNTTGSFVMDLTNETADAAITLTIDGETYGLAKVQTIKAVGTHNVDFTANEDAALTLAKGFIYSLSVKENGKMTVVAKEKGVNNGNYYLVGNFFEEDGDNINYDKKYFRFINSIGNGTLSFDIPASLEIKAQVYASDGTCYGPVNG